MAAIFFSQGLTGGSGGDLDDITVSSISDADIAVAVTKTDKNAYLYHYNSSVSSAESSPDIITPDDNGNNGRWILSAVVAANATLEDGILTLGETTTPGAVANYGKVYTKNDNKLYFQDGAGVEHEISLAT